MKSKYYLNPHQSHQKENKRYNNYPLIIKLLSFFAVLTLFIPTVSGQDYSRWKLPEGAKLRLGKGSVRKLTFSPDGKHLFVDSSIGIWTYDAQTGTELNLITKKPHEEVEVSPYNNIYASFGLDSTLQIRNLMDGNVIKSKEVDTESIRWTVFSPDNRTLASIHKENIDLWDFTTGEQKGRLTGHTGWIRDVAFSPDGSTLVSTDSDKTVRLWNVQTATYRNILSQHRAEISSIVFSQDGKTLIGEDRDNSLRLWDVATETEKIVVDRERVRNINISPDGKTIATSGSDTVRLWNAETGEHITDLNGQNISINGIDFSPDGSTLASGGGDTLYLWDVATGARKMSINGHTNGLTGIAVSSDFNTLATASREKILLWHPTTGKYKKMIFGGYWSYQRSLTFSPDGNTLASQASLNTHLWDITRGVHITALYQYNRDTQNNESGSSSIAFSPDGQLLAGGGRHSTLVKLWYKGRTLKAELAGHTAGITSVAFSHDSRFLVSGSHDHTVRLWDVASEAQMATFTGHSDVVLSVAFNPDASLVASGGKDGKIVLWDVATGESRIINTGHTRGINSLVFSRDGNILISGGTIWGALWNDPTVRIWDVKTGEQKSILAGHTSGKINVAFSPDGKTLLTGSGDGTVLIWDYNTIMGTKDVPSQQLAEHVNRDGNVDLQVLLLPNYPNPFNPETWIPFQLAKPAHVTLYIYGVDGQLVRTLKLGNKQAGLYHSKNRAAYWDGKNAFGEPVASGIYYYTLSTGEFSATRRMVIRR